MGKLINGQRLSPWIPALAMMLVSFISYIDRNVLAILAPSIREATQINEEEYGWVITAFSIAYMIGNPVWGWILDRFGLRIGMTAAVLFWTAASASHAWASGFWDLALARALLGFGEGATFPGGLRAVMQTLPPHSRARGVALAYSGGSLGAIIAPLVVTPIYSAWGWRPAFLFTGLIGIAWILVWQAVAARPDIRHGGGFELQPAAGEARPHFADRRTWAFMFAYALGGAPLAFILYYTASYLGKTFGLSQESIGTLLWIPPLGWEVGYFFWGWVTDRCHRTGANPLSVDRRLFCLLAVLSLALGLVPNFPSLYAVMALKFFAMVIAAGFIIVALSYATHVYSTRSSGLIAGLGAGAWGAGVAITSPLFGRLFDGQQYTAAFWMAAFIPGLGLILWLVLSRRDAEHSRPVAVPEPQSEEEGASVGSPA